jgi:hypothetical protein
MHVMITLFSNSRCTLGDITAICHLSMCKAASDVRDTSPPLSMTVARPHLCVGVVPSEAALVVQTPPKWHVAVSLSCLSRSLLLPCCCLVAALLLQEHLTKLLRTLQSNQQEPLLVFSFSKYGVAVTAANRSTAAAACRAMFALHY